MKSLHIILGVIGYLGCVTTCIAFMVSCNKNLEKDDIAAIAFLEKTEKSIKPT